MRLHRDEGIGDATDEDDEGRSPVHQFSVHSSVDLPHQVTWDTIVRYVDRLRTVPAPAYLELDLRVGWRPIKSVELSISGQNLLDNHHPEFRPTTFQTQSTEVPRSIYGKVTLRF